MRKKFPRHIFHSWSGLGTLGWNVSMQMLLLQQGQYLAHPVYLLEARGMDPRHPLALHFDWMKMVIMTRGALLDAFPLFFLVPLPQKAIGITFFYHDRSKGKFCKKKEKKRKRPLVHICFIFSY